MALAFVIALAGGGCRLIDQRTFQASRKAPGAAELARAAPPALPLVTMFLDQPDVDWRTPLRAAVLAAQARKPDVAFSVLVPIPTAGTPVLQDQFAKVGVADARTVANALLADQVSPENVVIGFRGDPGLPRAREVRVYVR